MRFDLQHVRAHSAGADAAGVHATYFALPACLVPAAAPRALHGACQLYDIMYAYYALYYDILFRTCSFLLPLLPFGCCCLLYTVFSLLTSLNPRVEYRGKLDEMGKRGGVWHRVEEIFSSFNKSMS